MAHNKLAKICLILLIASVLGFVSAVITNSFVSRSESDYSQCLQVLQNTQHDCTDKAVKSSGWPFPSKYTTYDGTEINIQTDTYGYCIGGCGIKSIGGQFIYNAIILSIAYLVLIVIFRIWRRS